MFIQIEGYDYPLSVTLMQILMNENFNEDFKPYINVRMKDFLQQINDAKKTDSDSEILLGLYKLYDEIWSEVPDRIKSEIKCRKGCSFCCHINVDIHDTEANLIFEELGAQGKYGKIDWNTLEKQKGLDINERIKSSDSKCIFLENGDCSIYEFRPVSCRKFFVVSDPKNCDVSDGVGNTTAIQPILDMEILSAAINVAFPKIGVMADVMLKLRKK